MNEKNPVAPNSSVFALARAQLWGTIAAWARNAGLPLDLDNLDLLYMWARAQVAAWEDSGLLDTIPDAGRYSEAAALRALLDPDDSRNRLRCGIALILSAMDVFVRRFAVVGQLRDADVDLRLLLPETSAALAGDAGIPRDADFWMARLADMDGATRAMEVAPTMVIVQATPIVSPSPAEPLEIDEASAAEKMGYKSKKALRNARGRGEIPSHLYRRLGNYDNSGVRYHRAAIEQYVAEKYKKPELPLKKRQSMKQRAKK